MHWVYRLLYDNIDNLRLHLMETVERNKYDNPPFLRLLFRRDGEFFFLIYRKNIPQGFCKIEKKVYICRRIK